MKRNIPTEIKQMIADYEKSVLSAYPKNLPFQIPSTTFKWKAKVGNKWVRKQITVKH